MKTLDIIEIIAQHIENKIIKDFKHEGYIDIMYSDSIYVIIDGKKYCVKVTEEQKESKTTTNDIIRLANYDRDGNYIIPKQELSTAEKLLVITDKVDKVTIIPNHPDLNFYITLSNRVGECGEYWSDISFWGTKREKVINDAYKWAKEQNYVKN